nr:hypothetical protein CFP56_03834 [Quercus suber]
MRITTSILASLLASVVVARPRTLADGDPLPQKSRVTAFAIDKEGNPSVECWEITNMVDSKQVRRPDGSKATAYSMPLASSSSELDGLDILTWPTYSPIWPIPDESVQAEYFDLHNTFNEDEDEDETHIFSLENGDDWFYFEDNYSGSSSRKADSKPSPFTISTISSTETELLRLRFNQPPKHKVVHKGACSFTGIKTPDESSSYESRTSRVHSPLTVQVNIDDSL